MEPLILKQTKLTSASFLVTLKSLLPFFVVFSFLFKSTNSSSRIPSQICIEYATTYDQTSHVRPSLQKIQLLFNLTCIHYDQTKVSKLVNFKFVPKDKQQNYVQCGDIDSLLESYEKKNYENQNGNNRLTGWSRTDYCSFGRDSKAIIKNLGSLTSLRTKKTDKMVISNSYFVHFQYLNLHLIYCEPAEECKFIRSYPKFIGPSQKISFGPTNFHLNHPDKVISLKGTYNKNWNKDLNKARVKVYPSGMDLRMNFKITGNYYFDSQTTGRMDLLKIGDDNNWSDGSRYPKIQFESNSYQLVITYGKDEVINLKNHLSKACLGSFKLIFFKKEKPCDQSLFFFGGGVFLN